MGILGKIALGLASAGIQAGDKLVFRAAELAASHMQIATTKAHLEIAEASGDAAQIVIWQSCLADAETRTRIAERDLTAILPDMIPQSLDEVLSIVRGVGFKK